MTSVMFIRPRVGHILFGLDSRGWPARSQHFLKALRIASILSALGAFLFGGLSVAMAQVAVADVSERVYVSHSPFTKNSSTNTIDTTVTLQNVGAEKIYAPLKLVINPRPASMILANASGTMPDGKTYINVALLDDFAFPGERIYLTLKFSKKTSNANLGNVPIRFSAQVLAGKAPAAVAVRITEPTSGNILYNPSALVVGTVSGPPGTGVNVNGQPACVFNGQFFANDVPIASDSTTLTATGVSLARGTGQDTVAVTPESPLAGLKISGNACGGVAPFSAVYTVSIRNLDASSLQGIEVDFDGDGVDDYASSNLTQPIQFTFTVPKIYRTRFTLRETNGTLHTVYRMVQVQSPLQAQQPLIDTVGSLKNALSFSNIPRALSYFSVGGQQRYATIFAELNTQLPVMVSTWSGGQSLSILDGYAEFGIVRPVDGRDLLFRVVFLKDENGIWKIDSM